MLAGWPMHSQHIHVLQGPRRCKKNLYTFYVNMRCSDGTELQNLVPCSSRNEASPNVLLNSFESAPQLVEVLSAPSTCTHFQ